MIKVRNAPELNQQTTYISTEITADLATMTNHLSNTHDNAEMMTIT